MSHLCPKHADLQDLLRERKPVSKIAEYLGRENPEVEAKLGSALDEAGWLHRSTVAVDKPPTGPGWSHELKHDGYRMIGRWGGDRVHLFTRNGHDWSGRFPP